LDAGDPAGAATQARTALALWRGPPLAELSFEDFAQPEIRRLDELRLTALETRVDAELKLGHHQTMVSELQALLAQHPTRERFAAQLMLALYRSGRQGEALEVYHQIRRHLASELGLEPGPDLQALQAQILEHERSLQSDGTAWRSGVSGSLPRVPTRTIGRAHEIEAVCEAVRDRHTPLLTLVGPGGVGKTRLALEAAHALRSSMPDGVCWIELAGVADAEEVGAAIARALSVVTAPGESTVGALKRFLAVKRLVLVVDNFEHVLPAADLVAELIHACPQLKVLATSREALNLSAERRFAVHPLGLPVESEIMGVREIEAAGATALFLDAARRRDGDKTITPSAAAQIARICARLDGLPLAIELAAARLELFGVDMLAARLDDGSSLGHGPRDAPARQRTLAATIDWSYRLLDPEQQNAFARFGVFAGGATVEAAQSVTGARLETFAELIRKHLLVRHEGPAGGARLAMLETLRQYALERLGEDPDADTIRALHFQTFLDLADDAVPRLNTHADALAMTAIDSDLDNLHLALRWGLGHDPRSALRLAGLLGDYWWFTGTSDRLSSIDATIHAAGKSAPLRDRARAEFARMYQLILIGDHQSARRAATACNELSECAGADGLATFALAYLALINSWLGEVNAARTASETAYRRAQQAGDRVLLGRVLSVHIGFLPADAREDAVAEAAHYLSEAGDYRHLAGVYTNYGTLLLYRGQFREALRLFEHCLELARKGTTPWAYMINLENLAQTHLFLGDIRQAATFYAEELEILARHGLDFSLALTLVGIAALISRTGDCDRAARLRGAARAAGDPESGEKAITDRLEREFFAPARTRLGADAWRQGEQWGATLSRDEAIAYAREALSDITRQQPSPRHLRATA
jgi:predicted ATPase/Tfp pilus assembly protein PilF